MIRKALIAKDPAWAERFEENRQALQGIADDYIKNKHQAGAAERTTLTGTVPVIFHIVVTPWQYYNMGGGAGVIQRCDSQIAILNRDFNAENSDSTLIPSGWKALYGSSGIHFGLAHTAPTGYGTPGYEVTILSGADTAFSDIASYFASAKTTGIGTPSWDVDKYLNIWCVEFDGAASSILGATVSKSTTGGSTGTSPSLEGVVMLYKVLGNVGPSTGYNYIPYDLGRTLTHEVGHFFEIWHPWGDDGPGSLHSGYCPWDGGADDGLGDTPPQSGATYGNPVYTITGGTFNDGCKMNGTTDTQPYGVGCLDFMDYTDDGGMHLFTPQQCAAMASMVLVPPTGGTGATGKGLVGENYDLSQHPELLNWPATTGIVDAVPLSSTVSLSPNPTTGTVNITFDASLSNLNSVGVVNLIGQQVLYREIDGKQKDIYSIDLSTLDKGIYFVRCNFASGTVIRKIILQ